MSAVAVFASGAFAEERGAYYEQGNWTVVQSQSSSPVFCLARYKLPKGNTIALHANENEEFSILIGRQDQNYTNTTDHGIRVYLDGKPFSDYTVSAFRSNILAIDPLGAEETDSLQPLLSDSRTLKVLSTTYNLEFEVDLTDIDRITSLLWNCTDGKPYDPTRYEHGEEVNEGEQSAGTKASTPEAAHQTPIEGRGRINLAPSETIGDVSGWSVGFTENLGYGAGYRACIAIGQYRSGSSINIAKDHHGNWWFAVSNQSWQSIEDQKEYDISFRIDRRNWNVRATGILSYLGTGLLFPGISDIFILDFAKSSKMYIIYQGNTIDHFSLAGTRAAIDAINSCYSRRIANSDPFSKNSSLVSNENSISEILRDRISCTSPFSVAETYDLLLSSEYIGQKIGGTDNSICFSLRKPLDLLSSEHAPIEYLCFAGIDLETKYPDIFRGLGPRYEMLTIGFEDKGEAIEHLWNDGTSPIPLGFTDEREISGFSADPRSIQFADAEWRCFPPH